MKNFYLFILLSSLLFSQVALADTTSLPTTSSAGIKVGTWTFSFYQAGNPGQVSSSFTICGGGTGWGLAGPVRVSFTGSGGFALTGTDVYMYGELIENKKTLVLSAFGKLINPELLTGTYQTYNVQSASPNGDYGTFEAVYDGLACPL